MLITYILKLKQDFNVTDSTMQYPVIQKSINPKEVFAAIDFSVHYYTPTKIS